MAHNSYFGGIIWTNHVLERLGQRGLSQEMALKTFKDSDKKIHGKQPGTFEFHKKFGKSYVTVIGKKNEKNEWIVLSAWIDPPYYGTHDWKKKQNYNAYQKAGIWGKLWILFKQQIGL